MLDLVPVLERHRLTGRRFRSYRSIFRFCQQEGTELDAFWALPQPKLRRLRGAGPGPRQLPYMLGERTTRVIDLGIDALMVLARMRHRQFVGTSEWDGILLTEAYEQVAESESNGKVAPVPSWQVEDPGPGLTAARVARASAIVDPWLDPGLILAWLAPGTPGGSMLKEIEGVHRSAFLEERENDVGEPTSYLATLALAGKLIEAWERSVITIHSAAFAERMAVAGSVLLHAMLEESVTAAFENPSVVDTKIIDVRAEYLLRTCISPITFLPPRPAGPASAEIYGLEPDIVERLKQHNRGLELETTDLEEQVLEVSEWAADQDGLSDLIVVRASLEEVRYAALHLASQLNPHEEGVAAEFGRLASEPDAARARLLHAQRRQELIEVLEDLAKRRPAIADAAVALAEAVSPGLSDTAMNPDTITTRVRDAVRAFLVLQCDERARMAVRRASRNMLDVGAAEGLAAAARAYEDGEIYRFAGDDRPILQKVGQAHEGQLFVDLADITRQTALLAPEEVTRMLQAEFYLPLLDVAGAIRNEAGDIRLYQMPGDAIAFSGAVGTLVKLIPKIRKILARYREKLESRRAEGMLSDQQRQLDKRIQERRADLAERRQRTEHLLRDVERGVGAPTPDETGTLRLGGTVIAEIRRLQNELFRIEEAEALLDREATRLSESGARRDAEAGIFLSHGRAADVVELDDLSWGKVSLVIGDTVRGAARGTERNANIRKRLDLVVQHARDMRGKADITYPFRLYIDKIWSVPIPPAMVPEFRFAIDERDAREAERLFGDLARRATSDFRSTASHSGPMAFRLIQSDYGIYNAGCALTESALLAYREASTRHSHFFQRDVALSELNAAFHEKFAFGRARLKLIFVVPIGGDQPSHIFRYGGSMVFRGAGRQEAVGIYELLNPEDEFYKLILQHHFKWWWQERSEVAETSNA